MRLKNGEKRRKLGGEMILKRFDDTVVVYREERIVYAEFLKPHRVISTCRVSGGIHDDMLYMYNHQSCEPARITSYNVCYTKLLREGIGA